GCRAEAAAGVRATASRPGAATRPAGSSGRRLGGARRVGPSPGGFPERRRASRVGAMSMLAIPPRLADRTEDLLQHQRSIAFVRFLSTLHEHRWPLVVDGLEHAYAERWRRDPCCDEVVKWIGAYRTKAAMAPGTTFDPASIGPLAAVRPLANAFLAYVRAA